MYFNHIWQGFEFEMEYIHEPDASTSHWTDIIFASEQGDVVVNGEVVAWIENEALTPNTRVEIRMGAFKTYQKLCEDPQDDELDKECHDYHVNKELNQ